MRTNILRVALLGALATTMLVATSQVPVVHAQPAAALGKPLPEGSMAVGTISVRVVAGSPSSPVVATEVTMTVNGEPRVARTDAAGRATFTGLPAGAMVQAKVAGEDKQEVASEQFQVPPQGGARLMLSTKPFEGMGGGGGGGGPMAGGMGGMPEARTMSGQPQPSRNDPAGTYAVRVTYNNLVMKDGAPADPNPPAGVPVMLAAYGADDSIRVLVQPTDTTGVAKFEALDPSGGTSYFAMAILPRGGSFDRLVAVPTVLDTQAGGRVILSGDKQDATSPPIDDYAKLIPRDQATLPAGKVRIMLDGVPGDGTQVTLYDAATMKPVGATSATRSTRPDPSQVRGGANFEPKADLKPGTVEIEVRGGAGQATDPMPGVAVMLVSANDEKPIDGAMGQTGMDGKLTLQGPTDIPTKAVFDINGRQMVSSGMELAQSGGKLEVTAQWPAQGRPEAVFDIAHTPNQVLYAQTTASGQVFRSLPIATVPDRGMQANIYIYPRTLFTFDTHSFVEDQLLAVQGTFEVTNYAWAPWKSGPDGLLIKLPKGHKGAVIAPQDQNDVSVATAEGFRITRPIPPGGRKFRAGFSMPIDRGSVDFAFDLPLGTWQSAMQIRQTPGMTVRMPQGIEGATQTASTGEPWFVIPQITLQPNNTLRLTIAGFPREAAWKVWMPRIIGVTVVLLMLGGIAFAMTRTSEAPSAEAEARRQKLMDELVELEKRGASTSKDRARREQLIDELERLWGASSSTAKATKKA